MASSVPAAASVVILVHPVRGVEVVADPEVSKALEKLYSACQAFNTLHAKDSLPKDEYNRLLDMEIHPILAKLPPDVVAAVLSIAKTQLLR